MNRTSAHINVPRFLAAMQGRRYTLVAAAVNCAVSTRTLAKILRGEWPARLDAFWRVVDGLNIPIEEATLNARPSQAPRLHVLPLRRIGKEIA